MDASNSLDARITKGLYQKLEPQQHKQEQGSGTGMSSATQFHQKGLDPSSRSDFGTSQETTAGGQQ
jgi:hypothetical protein